MANKDVEKLLEDFFSNRQIDPLSQSLLEDIRASVEAQVQIANKQDLETKEIKKIFEAFRALLKSEGLTSTKFSGKLTQVQNTLSKSTDTIDLDKLEKLLSNLTSSSVLQSQIAANRGDKNGVFSGSVTSSEAYKQIINDLAKRQKVNLMSGLNGFQRWLVGWTNGLIVSDDKKKKGLVKELIDGLAANKFVGGAAKDTVRLLGLLAGSWLKNHVKGPLGGALASLTYIASEVVATVVPLVLRYMLQGGFAGLVQGLVMGGLGKGAASSAAQIGASAMLGTGIVGATGAATTLRVKNTDTLKEALKNKKVAPSSKTSHTITRNGKTYTLTNKLPSASTQATTTAINKNTSILTKLLQPLNKMWAPISKIGGNMLKFGGNLAKFAGVAGVGIGSALNLHGAYQSAKQGDMLGMGLKGISGVTGIASLFSGPLAVPLIVTSVVTGILGAIWDMVKGGDKKPYTSANFPTTGSFPSLATGSSGGTGGGFQHRAQGGRDYVNTGTGLEKLINPKAAHISNVGRNFIKREEGPKSTPYWDVTGYATKWGMHKIDGKPVKPGQKYTEAQFIRSFNGYMSGAEKDIRNSLSPNAKVTQGMVDTLADIWYNYGGGSKAFKDTVSLINQGKLGEARSYVQSLKSNPERRKRSVQELWKFPLKTIPRGQVVEVSPEASTSGVSVSSATSTATEVAPPEAPKEETKETKNEVAEAIKDASKTLKEVGEGLKQVKEEEKPTGFASDLTNSILNAVGGIDIPGNDIAFDVLTKINNISIFGGQ